MIKKNSDGRKENHLTEYSLPKVAVLKKGMFDGGIQRTASSTFGSANVAMGPSFFYSPELTPESWLLPKSRQEVLKWVRIFYNLDPYLNSIISMHAMYPFSTFSLICHDTTASKIFQEAMFNWDFDWYDFILQASLSYRKFGEACLIGDTKISLLDGTEISIEELFKENKKDFYVYSSDVFGSMSPGKVSHVVCNGYREDILEVVLDNNEVVKCTSDHKFLMRDGTYKEAKDLKVTDSLMPLYRKPSDKNTGDALRGYEMYLNQKDNTWYYTHRRVCWKINGCKKGQTVHHKNFQRTDNRPENLVAMDYKEHQNFHVSLAGSPEALQRLWDGNKKYWDNPLRRKEQGMRASNPSPSTRKKLSAAGKKHNETADRPAIRKAYMEWYNNGGKELLSEKSKSSWSDPKYRETRAQLLKKVWDTMGASKKASFIEKCKNRWTPEARAAESIRASNVSEEVREKLKQAAAKRWNKPGAKQKHAETIKNIRENKFWNHKVKEVKQGAPGLVYDLVNVGEYNNFALTSGIFVHNCLWGNWDGEKKRWTNFICLDPDLIEIRQDPFTGSKVFELIPTVEIKKMVRDSLLAKDGKVPDVVIGNVMSNKRIPLDGDGIPVNDPDGRAYEPPKISTIARITDPGSVRGTPQIQCLVGSTKVALLDGTNPTLEELYNSKRTNFDIYSFNEEGDFVPTVASKVILNGKKKTIKVYLDNGDFIQCTPDHLFMLRNGEWVEAQTLKANDSLMPLHRKTSSLKAGDSLEGYEKVYVPKLDKYVYTHRLVSNYSGKLHHGMVVHHKNFSKKNNSFSNLEITNKKDHVKLHQELCNKAKQNPSFGKNVSRGLNKYWASDKSVSQRNLNSEARLENWKDPKYRSKMADASFVEKRIESVKEALKNPELRKRMIEGSKKAYATGIPQIKISSGVKKAWQDPKYRNHLVEVRQSASFRKQTSGSVSSYMKNKYPELKEVETLLTDFLKDTASDVIKFKGNNADRLRAYNYAHRRNLPVKVTERAGFVYLQKVSNHKVTSIIPAEEVNVYDIENAGTTHSFCVVTSDGSGVGVHNCLFKSLIYSDKIRLAQIAIADRHHLPIELWTVGHLTGDPNTSILPDENTLNNIREMIRAATSTPPFCLSEDSRILTSEGFKTHDQLRDTDEVATLNPNTNEIEYHRPNSIHIFDHDGEMIHFKTRKIDQLVTPNHKCWVQRATSTTKGMNSGKTQKIYGPWEFVEAKDVKKEAKFKTNGIYKGKDIPEVEILGHKINTETWMKFAGWMISEGSAFITKKEQYATAIVQGESKPKYQAEIQTLFDQLPFKYSCYEKTDKVPLSIPRHDQGGVAVLSEKTTETRTWRVNNKEFTEYCREQFGTGSATKQIPVWIKQLDTKYLKILLECLIKGDGCITDKNDRPLQYLYATISPQLKDDVLEIAWKCGYKATANFNKRDNIFNVIFSENPQNLSGTATLSHTGNTSMQKKAYKGKVWCVNVPNHLFVCERDGRIGVTGNSIVYSPLLKYEALSVSGKLLSIYEDLGFVENQILVGLGVNKNLILGEGPCADGRTRVLTKNGAKNYKELTLNDEVATFNPKTGNLEYHKPTNIHIQDYDGEMIHFKTQKIDHMVSPNHRCWIRPTKNMKMLDWQVTEAKNVRKNDRLSLKVGWEGKKELDFIEVAGQSLSIETYLKLAGLFISEGHVINNEATSIYQIGFTQKITNKDFKEMDEFLTSLPFNIKEYYNDYDNKHIGGGTARLLTKGTCKMWRASGRELARHFEDNFGRGAHNKKIPTWMKNLPKEHLLTLLKYLMQGDGAIHKASSRHKNAKSKYNTYCTVSKQLAEDVFEVSLKCGNVPHISSKRAENNSKDPDAMIQLVNWSDKVQDQFILNSKKSDSEGNCIGTVPAINKAHYKGVIWCPEVQNGLFIAERNGRYIITGNSFSNVKTVALHRLIMEYQSVRDTFSNWIKKYVLLPIAIANNLKDENGMWIVPEIKWSKSLNAEGEKEDLDRYFKFWKEGLISTPTLFSKMPDDIHYEEEKKRLETEIGSIFDKGDKRLPKMLKAPGIPGAPAPLVPPIKTPTPDAALGLGEPKEIKPEVKPLEPKTELPAELGKEPSGVSNPAPIETPSIIEVKSPEVK